MVEVSTGPFQLPKLRWQLEEINLPPELVRSLAGQVVTESVHPEEAPGTRHVEPDDVPLWIDPQGKYWNDYRPVRVFFDDPEGNTWRLPRRWFDEFFGSRHWSGLCRKGRD